MGECLSLFSGRVRWDKIKAHLANKLTLLLVPSRGGVASLKLPVFVCYILLGCVFVAGGWFCKFYSNYRSLAQIAQQQEQALQENEEEKQKLEHKSQRIVELAKQTEEMQNQVEELSSLGEKIQNKALEKKLLPERELAKLGWKRGQTTSRSRGFRRPPTEEEELDESSLKEHLDELSVALPQQEAELKQLLRQLDQYLWLVERYPSQWPVHGRLTSSYGYRIHPLRFRRIFHEGIDLAVPRGTSVKAAASGKVIFAGNRSGYGRTIIISHGQGIQTLYAHNSRLHVKTGQWIEKGQVICASGNTGNSTGPHLHFEVRENGKPKNPLNYLS